MSGTEHLSARSTMVTVNRTTLVSTYQPLWDGDTVEFKAYRQELSGMVLKSRKTSLIVGGDFNLCVGRYGGERDAVASALGIGGCNEAGKDLLSWCQEQNLCWVNFFPTREARDIREARDASVYRGEHGMRPMDSSNRPTADRSKVLGQ